MARAVTLIADMDTQLQGIVSNLPSRYPGTTADYFYFGDAFGQVTQTDTISHPLKEFCH